MATIVRIAHKTPPHAILQKSLASNVAKASNLDAQGAKWLERVYEQSGITTRHSVLEDFSNDVENWSFWNKGSPSTFQRNALYKLHAPILSESACRQVLSEWGQDPKSLTHIIFVSCTGIVAPGIQAYLQNALGLNTSICQLAINMMGCFGAFKALQVAQSFCDQNSCHKVLIVCTELCSLHFQQTTAPEAQIGNALFADGSAACIVENDHQTGIYRIEKQKSAILPDTADKMTWEISDNGLIFGLKKDIPELIKQHVHAFATSLLPENTSLQECLWPIHPGGKGILLAVEQALGLSKEHTATSWSVLNQYGNISSATFLFVLNALRQQKSDKKWAVGLGFGPGLCFEGILLEVL
jgi:predicted naringenin-chalcone synthase